VAHLYEVGLAKTTGAAAGPITTLVTAAGARAEIREIGVFQTTGVAGEVGLGRPAAAGTGTLTGSLGQALDAADAASVTELVTSFGTLQPTAPTIPFRRIQLPGTVGAGVVWVWEPGALLVAVSAQLVVWQFSALAVGYDVYMKYVE
jgi:hypothetical protein